MQLWMFERVALRVATTTALRENGVCAKNLAPRLIRRSIDRCEQPFELYSNRCFWREALQLSLLPRKMKVVVEVEGAVRLLEKVERVKGL
jgi:hypothetical protein